MDPHHEVDSPVREIPQPVLRLLSGLWQQREELGLIADELLGIFRDYGFTLPADATPATPPRSSRG